MSDADHSVSWRAVVDQLGDGVLVQDVDGRLLYMNAEAERQLGGGLDAFANARNVLPVALQQAGCARCRPTERRCLQDICRRDDEQLVRADGTTFAAAMVTSPLREDAAVVGTVTVFRDITRLRTLEVEQARLIEKLGQTQAQLLQSEKMASIGQLAAGIAHEINNPVGYVSSNLGTLRRYLGELFEVLDAYQRARDAGGDDGASQSNLQQLLVRSDIAFLRQDMQDMVAESLEGVSRVRQIVQDLKDFSHVDVAEWAWADLHRGLDSTLNIVHNELKYKATVVKEYGELPTIECIASQLNQVFMNLLVNAAHAIAEKGTITVRTGTDNAGWVWVEIGDTGCGIAPEHLQRIFEPFFTTKPVGKGTGLGLSLTYSIVKRHHGRIEVSSEVGKGSTFRVWLPTQQPAHAEGVAREAGHG